MPLFLISVLNVSRVGLIEVSKIDAALGECLVAFGCAGMERGIVLIRPEEGGWVDPEQVKMLLPQAGLNWKIMEDCPEPHEIRDSLFEMAKEYSDENSLIVPLDQHFNVQGIGTVGIGYVQSGAISKHDEVEELIREVYGDAWNSNIRVQRVVDIIDINGDGVVSFDEFQDFNKRYPCMLFPAFKMQQALRNGIYGERWWRLLTHERLTKNFRSQNIYELLDKMTADAYQDKLQMMMMEIQAEAAVKQDTL